MGGKCAGRFVELQMVAGFVASDRFEQLAEPARRICPRLTSDAPHDYNTITILWIL